jgi:hypothetical protein
MIILQYQIFLVDSDSYTHSRIACSSFIPSLEWVERKLQEHLKVNAILVRKLKKEYEASIA